MSPSEIDMGRYRNVAVASCVPFRGFHEPPFYVRAVDDDSRDTRIVSSYDRTLAQDAASYATESLISHLRGTGFFSITPPVVTDSLVERSRHGIDISREVDRQGIDAFIVPRIVSMDVNEYVSSERDYVYDYSHVDEEGRPKRILVIRHNLTQTVSLVYSYTVIDAESMSIYATKTFSDKREYTEEVSSSFFHGTDPYVYLKLMIDDMNSLAAGQLAPRRMSASVTLMDNKPKDKAVEEAYGLASDGYLSQARSLFLDEWERTGHLPSGYNAALLTASQGDLDGAIAMLEDMQGDYASSEVDSLLSRLRNIRMRDDQAQLQLTGGGPVSNYNDSEGSIFSLVMGV